MDVGLVLFFERVEALEDDDVVGVETWREFLFALAELEDLHVPEGASDAVYDEGLAGTGAAVQIEGLADECCQESQLDTEFTFGDICSNRLH